MFFRKNSEKNNCPSCKSKIEDQFNYCPYCANPLTNFEKDLKDFGMLGKNDSLRNIEEEINANSLGVTDKLIGSIFNSLVKNLDKQFKEMEKINSNEIKSIPNGIKITIGTPKPVKVEKKKSHYINKNDLTKEQMEKMSSLPRASAKTNMRRLNDKVVYELSTPGVESINDIFVSKLEQGYEIKAIGNTKVYVNSLPVELPIKGFILDPPNKKLFVEFKTNLE